MKANELLKRVWESKACSKLDYDLMQEIGAYLQKPPTVVNISLHGTRVVSVTGPFYPEEAAQYAKIAASVGGIRVTSIRMANPPKKFT
jgi:hypothetical protein